MYPSVEETVRRFNKAADKLARRHRRNPAEAKAFLIAAGIAEKSPSSPNGIRLVKQLRRR